MKKKRAKLNVSKSILFELHALIAEKYGDGGRLPSSREMCAKLNVSLPTYGKAIKALMTSGIAYKDSNKGIFIYPDGYIQHRVGVVVDYAKESPFLGFTQTLPSFLSEMYNAGYAVQIIQASSPDALLANAELYSVSGLFFIAPEFPFYPWIRRFTQEKKMPILTLRTADPKDESFLLDPECISVNRDYQAEGKHRLKLFQEYGFDSIGYVGSPWFIDYINIPTLAKKAGIALHIERPLDSIPAVQTNLRGLIKKKKIQALYVEGGLSMSLCIFNELYKLKPEQRPAMIFSYFPQLRYLISQHKDLRCLGACKSKDHLLGQYGAKIFLDHLKKGTPLESQELDTFQYIRF